MITGTAITGTVLIHGKPLKATAILLKQEGSDKYTWGGNKRETTKLALALLYEILDGHSALKHHNHFREHFVETLAAGKDFEISLKAIHEWFKKHDLEVIMDFGNKPCSKCTGFMAYQSSRWRGDQAAWRCTLCGTYEWEEMADNVVPGLAESCVALPMQQREVACHV